MFSVQDQHVQAILVLFRFFLSLFSASGFPVPGQRRSGFAAVCRSGYSCCYSRSCRFGFSRRRTFSSPSSGSPFSRPLLLLLLSSWRMRMSPKMSRLWLYLVALVLLIPFCRWSQLTTLGRPMLSSGSLSNFKIKFG